MLVGLYKKKKYFDLKQPLLYICNWSLFPRTVTYVGATPRFITVMQLRFPGHIIYIYNFIIKLCVLFCFSFRISLLVICL